MHLNHFPTFLLIAVLTATAPTHALEEVPFADMRASWDREPQPLPSSVEPADAEFFRQAEADHGCEIVNGLSELYAATAHGRPDKKRQYQKPIHRMLDDILAKARNPDGLFYSEFNPKTGIDSQGLCDTWGYVYDAFYTVYMVDGVERYRDAIRFALGNLLDKYEGTPWDDRSADGYADSIEGALNLYNREPISAAAEWIHRQTRRMWAIQKPDGIIEGWQPNRATAW